MRDLELGFRARATAIAGALALAVLAPGPVTAQPTPTDFTAVVREKMPAVVGITTRQRVEEMEQSPSIPGDLPFREFFRRYYDERSGPRPQRPRQALGSGFVISAEGHIITNNHVVEDAAEIQVVFGERANVPATVVGRDPATDIAVLKVEPQPNMAVASWGDSAAAEPGSWVIAIEARSDWAAPSRSGSSRRGRAISVPAPTTTTSRRTPRSTAATPAVLSSTPAAR